METAKKKFEQERTKVLSELPDDLKAMFGQIGFGPASDAYDDDEEENGEAKPPASDEIPAMIPVLILSPYDVPPKPVRDIYWFDLFAKNKRSKTLDSMAHLVYHYGSEDPDDCYSFLEQEDFLSYEEGCRMGYGHLPDHVQAKMDAGAELTEDEAQLVRGYSELLEDAAKPPAERKRGVDFQERHEQLKAPPAKRKRVR